jgi:hypothetical protein
MKVRLMAEQVLFGNDEPANQMRRRRIRCRVAASSKWADHMTFSVSRVLSFSNFKPRYVAGALGGLALAIAMSSSPVSAGPRAGGAYDGNWNVTFTTRAGNCSSTNSAPFAVSGRQISSAGGGKVTGGISPNGAVSVRISVGASAANGSGRLAGNSGSGRWSGVISGDKCSGTWQASRA